MPFTDDFNTAGGNEHLETRPGWTRVEAVDGENFGYASGVSDACGSNNTGSGSGHTSYTCTSQGTEDHFLKFDAAAADFVSFWGNRLTDKDNFIGIRQQSGKLQIFKNVAASFLQLGTTGTTTLTGGEVIRFESTSADDHIAYIDDVEESNPGTPDTAHNTVQTQGVIARDTAGTKLIGDNFEATALGGASAVISASLTLLGAGD